MDNPTYRAAYFRHLRTFASGPFAPATAIARVKAAHALVAPYVVGPGGERPGFTFLNNAADFTDELKVLTDHASKRAAEIALALRGN
jgi:hypothetical protein